MKTKHYVVLRYVFSVALGLLLQPLKADTTLFVGTNGTFFISNSAIVHVNGDAQVAGTDAVLDNNGDLFLSNAISAGGNMIISPLALSKGNGVYHVHENWVNDGSFDGGTSEVKLLGDTQYIEGTSVTRFYDLNLLGTGEKVLEVNAEASNLLALNDRTLHTQTHTFFVDNTNSTSLTRSTGYVVSNDGGFLQRRMAGSDEFLYPVASDQGAFRYRPVRLSSGAYANQVMAIRFANLDANLDGYDRSMVDSSICSVNPEFYHQIKKVSGSDMSFIDIAYDDQQDYSATTIAYYTPSNEWSEVTSSNTITSAVSPNLTRIKSSLFDDFNLLPFALARKGIQVTDTFNQVACNGGNDGYIGVFSQQTNSSLSYLWSNNQTTSELSNIGVGSYQLTITDSSGCSLEKSYNLTSPDPILVAQTWTPNQCFGDTDADIVAFAYQGGVTPYEYQWSTGDTTFAIDSLASGTYDLTVTDQNNCTYSASYQIPEVDSITIAIDSLIEEDCGYANGLLLASATGGNGNFSFSWNDPLSQQMALAENLSANAYQVTATDFKGCENILEVVLPANYKAEITSALDSGEYICERDSSFLSVSSNGTITSYAWSNGDTTAQASINPLDAQNSTYYVTIENGLCTAIDTFDVDVRPNPTLSFQGDTVLCQKQDGYLAAISDAVSYLWSTGDTTTDIYFTADSIPSMLSVTVTSIDGCVTDNDDDPVALDIKPSPTALFDTTAFGNFGDAYTFTDQSTRDVVSWEWDFGDDFQTLTQSPTHVYLDIGSYDVQLVVENEFECADTSVMNIEIEEFIKVPNVFTPNGDGYNDEFVVAGLGFNEYNLVIKNRWGEVIFRSESNRLSWDGRSQSGLLMKEGTYFYELKAVGTEDYSRAGHVTLLR